MDYEKILYQIEGPVATVTLNDPERLNALSPTLEAELHAALDRADADRAVRAIVLRGAGRGFCAGYDIAPAEGRMGTLDPTGLAMDEYIRHWWDNDIQTVQKLLRLWYLSKPVIAAVHGWAMGGGTWYALAADLTIASEDAVFGQPEVRHVSNTTFLFAALTNWKQANRFALTGDHLDAREAWRLGLINEVVPASELDATVRQLAERIARVPEASVRINKAVTAFGLEAMGLRAAMLLNGALSALAHTSHGLERERLFDAMRTGGLRAFLQERDGPFRPEPFGPRSRAEGQGGQPS